ncbi:MAG: PIN domain-containing protein [Desulfonauticus sp.]|nr:PIN domain-containing protein [Desulfonauticus sp.]
MKNKIVVDANILFSALLKRKNPFIKIILNANCDFFAPKFLFLEIFKHKHKIEKFSSLTEKEILELMEVLLEKLEFISLKEIDKKILKNTYQVCEIDKLDVPFVALTLFLDAKLWTGDRKLCSSLKNKGFDICISTQEIAKLMIE